MSRRATAGAAAVLLLALILVRQPWSELPRRVRSLRLFGPRELAVRRLGGSGAAFDRRFFSFLENARRRLPKDIGGIAVETRRTPLTEAHRYLAVYVFAPLPVRFDDGPVPRDWVVAVYGGPAADGDRPRTTLPEGYLLGLGP